MVNAKVTRNDRFGHAWQRVLSHIWSAPRVRW